MFDVALRDPDLGPDHLPRRPPARPPRPLARSATCWSTSGAAEPGALRDALARALRDPSLELAYWVPRVRGLRRHRRRPGRSSRTRPGRVTTFVERDGTPVAALIHDASLAGRAGARRRRHLGRRDRARERAPAGRPARAAERPAASRARIVEAGDTARRKLERDLHDGAQQRLVCLIASSCASSPASSPRQRGGRAAGQSAREELNASLEELRNIARGIHPAILSDHGLPVALESLAARAPVRSRSTSTSPSARRRRSRSPRTT